MGSSIIAQCFVPGADVVSVQGVRIARCSVCASCTNSLTSARLHPFVVCVHNKITGTPKPKNQSHEAGTYALNSLVLLMPNGRTLLESYAKDDLKFQGIIVFSSLLHLDVTKIEKLV